MFSILNLEFPADFENACTEYIIAEQGLQTRINQLEVVRIESKTNITATQVDAEILENKANATSYVTQIQKENLGNITKERFSYYKEAFTYVKTQLGFTNDQLLDFLQIYLMKFNVAKKAQLWTDV